MKSFLIIAAVLALLLLATIGYLFTPPVYAVRTAQGVAVHFETLGEYPSDIDQIEVVEKKSGRMVWRVTARGEMFQLHRFQLVPGMNMDTLQPSWETPRRKYLHMDHSSFGVGSPIAPPCVSEGGRTYAGTLTSLLTIVDQNFIG